jgi:hypothetical protein
MADVTVTSLQAAGDRLSIFGTGFTKTTTTVYVDEVSTAFELVSDTEITITPVPDEGAEIVVEKGGIQTDPMTYSAVPGALPLSGQQDAPGATGVVNEDSNATGPMTPTEPYPAGTPTATQINPPLTPADYTTEQEKEALSGSEGNTGMVPAEDTRTEQEKTPGVGPISEPVEPVEPVETIQQQGIGPRDPYPTGNPPDPEEGFRQAHGYYRRSPGGEAPAEVTGNLSDPHAAPPPDEPEEVA